MIENWGGGLREERRMRGRKEEGGERNKRGKNRALFVSKKKGISELRKSRRGKEILEKRSGDLFSFRVDLKRGFLLCVVSSSSHRVWRDQRLI